MIYFNQLLFLKKQLIFLLPLKNRGPTSSASMDEPPLVCTYSCVGGFLCALSCSVRPFSPQNEHSVQTEAQVCLQTLTSPAD